MNNTIDRKYTNLQRDILDNGTKKGDRTGTGTISVFGRQIRHDMSEGFPLLTTKKMAWKSMVIELLWFLKGDTNIQWLVQNDCNIWVGDAYKAYSKHVKKEASIGLVMDREKFLTRNEFIEKIKVDDSFAEKWGELGPIYGKQWRGWRHGREMSSGVEVVSFYEYDQLGIAINTLIKNPDSRRMMVNAWNVGEISEMVLPPCHYGFQFWTRELTDDEILKLATERLSTKEYMHYLELKEIRKKMKDLVYNQEFEKAAELMKEREVIENKLGGKTPPNIPTRGVSLMWNQRSVDTFLGLPFNIASYGLLLQIIAQHVNMVPLELIGSLGDTHLYLNHIIQSEEQITREGFELPEVQIAPFDNLEDLTFEHFELIGYESHPRIKAPLSN